jgi:urease accessory protein
VATASITEAASRIESGATGTAREAVRAALRLEFERDAATGRTVLKSSRQEAPLRVVRAFAIDDGAALVHLHNVSGGLLGGDQLSLQVNCGCGTSVQITTTGATRIYRPRSGAPITIQANEIVVKRDALLEYLPDPLIPFAGANFVQRTAIHMEEGAGLFWWEIVAPGREARGEVFEYAKVELKTDVIAGGKLIAAERVRLEPKKRELKSLARMGPYRTWATFYVCRVGVAGMAWMRLEGLLREVLSGWSEARQALWGVSALPVHGLVVRCVSRRGLDVMLGLREIWRVAKREVWGREAVAPRKVN